MEPLHEREFARQDEYKGFIPMNRLDKDQAQAKQRNSKSVLFEFKQIDKTPPKTNR